MTLGPFRPLHWVLRVSDRKESMNFFLDTLGMRVNRHEDFKEGCEAQCNGPYDNRWSKTMIGYASEDEAFNLEVTYNYTHKEKYAKGNDLGYISLSCAADVLDKVRESSLSKEIVADGIIVTDPEGYRFKVVSGDGHCTSSSITGVRINARNPDLTAQFYKSVLGMRADENEGEIRALRYEGKIPFVLEIAPSDEAIDFKEAGGRLAVSAPNPAPFQKAVKDMGLGRVHTPFVELHTPGKTSVAVVILQDPDGSEVCVVNEDGFTELSQVDPDGHAALLKDIEDDKSAATS